MRPARRFDLLEVVAIAVFAALCGWLAADRLGYTTPMPPEARPLLEKYGVSRHSLGPEELIIRDFFQDAPGGVFVDVGAADYQADNNTYYLETKLGWSGLAVDALARYAAGYAKHRPRTRFFARFVSDATDQKMRVYVPKDTRQAANRPRPEFGPATEEDVPTVTLTHLLTETGISRIDFLSIDVEFSEPHVLAGFDIDRFRPRLVCIEAFPRVRQQILDYFAAHGYVVVGAYLRVDPLNLYFRPLR